ncbi:MAG: DUF4058 family protein [Planctomycetota bacterium]
MAGRTKSPFPGMDPFLERTWSDVHGRLVTYAADALSAELPDDLATRTERHIAVDDDADGESSSTTGIIVPDVEVVDSQSETRGGVAVLEASMSLAPLKLLTDGLPKRRRHIGIVDLDGKLVTVIEFVSPANKIGRGRRDFLRKRRRLIKAGVHVVEIDLTREGKWRRLYEGFEFPKGSDTEYRAIIFAAGRVDEPPTPWLHPMPLAEPLPTIKIPLRPKDEPTELSLQPLVDATYRNGRYGRTIRYDDPCWPELPESAMLLVSSA